MIKWPSFNNLFIVLAFVLAVACLPAGRAHAEVRSELHVGADGKLTAKNLVVMQKSENGATFFVRATWGGVYLRLTVLATPSGVAATIIKNNGGPATYKDVVVGDLLEVEGTLSPQADTLLIQATKIRDLSLNVEGKTVAGVIKKLSGNVATLTDKLLGTISVVVPYSIEKGVRAISAAELAVGDRVVSAVGAYDYASKTFTASSMEVYQDQSLFVGKNFEGTLKSISDTTLPVTLVVSVGKNEYTVYLPAGSSILRANKSATSLTRYTIGDTVRFYGAIRPTNLSEIDAEILRNLSF